MLFCLHPPQRILLQKVILYHLLVVLHHVDHNVTLYGLDLMFLMIQLMTCIYRISTEIRQEGLTVQLLMK